MLKFLNITTPFRLFSLDITFVKNNFILNLIFMHIYIYAHITITLILLVILIITTYLISYYLFIDNSLSRVYVYIYVHVYMSSQRIQKFFKIRYFYDFKPQIVINRPNFA